MREQNGRFLLDLTWRGEARRDVTIGKYDYGGLFLRMPWRQGINGEVVNAARQRNARAEGQRAMWVDVGDAGRRPRRSRAHRDLRPSRQRRLSAAVARRRSARRRHRARAHRRLVDPRQPDRSHPPPLRRLHRHAGRRRDDQCVHGIRRQPIDVLDHCAVGHRAAGRTRRIVPLAAGCRGEHDHCCRLQGQRVGGRTDGHAADGVLLGRPRAAVGGGEPRLRVARAGLLERRRQPHRDSRGHRPRRRRRQPQGVPRGHPVSGGDRRGLRRTVPRRATESPVRSRSQRRRQGGHGGHRSAADRLGHLRPSRNDQQPALGPRRVAVRTPGIRHHFEGPEAGGQGTLYTGQGAVSRAICCRARASRSTAASGAITRRRIDSKSSRTGSAIRGASTTTRKASW